MIDGVRRAAATAAGPAAVAVVASVICVAAGLRGPDVADQVYRVIQVARHGVVVWDAGWYGGTFPVNYSLVFPVVAALTGVWVTTAGSAALAAACFDRLVRLTFGRRPVGSWYFAVSTVVEVAVGQMAFLTGEALAFAAVLAVVRRRTALGAALGVVTALASPVAAAFLALALVAWGLSERQRRWSLLAAGLLPLVVVGAVAFLFPGTGSLPFGGANAACIVVVCGVLASPLVPAPRMIKVAAALYAIVTVGLFVVPTEMGNNDMRLAAYVGVPLLMCYAAGRIRSRVPWAAARRWVAPLAVVPLVVWAWAPAMGSLGNDVAAARASFYQPLLAHLRSLAHTPVRVEVTPTREHWESEWVAPSYALARGWERQLDMGYDPLFYGPGPLTATAYHRWLLDEGVSFVALPRAPLDYAAVQEGALLRHGEVPDLRLVWHSADWELWRVVGSGGLAVGPARVTALQGDRVGLEVTRPGAVTVKVRWSPYWSVPPGAGCLAEAPGDWTELRAATAGPVDITTSLLPGSRNRCPG